MPDFTKLGFELVAFTFAKWLEKAEASSPYKWLEKDSRVVFVAEGNGLGKNSIIVTMHKNYTDYSDFIADLRKTKTFHTSNSFIVALTDVKKHFNLAGLEKV